MVIKAIVIIFCIYIIGCQSNNELKNLINKFNWPFFINKIEHNYLKIFKVNFIWITAFYKM